MASTLYYNGDIITMERPLYAEALLIKDGKIAAVGTFADVVCRREADTENVDLAGKTLMPSFIDPHGHMSTYARKLDYVALDDARCFADIIDKIAAFKRERNLSPEQIITGHGYDHNFLKEQAHPTKEILDVAGGGNPVIISHANGHMGVASSRMLEYFGIDSGTTDPQGGVIGRAADGREPNGYLEETAYTAAIRKKPGVPEAHFCGLLEQIQREYLKYGITTVQDGMVPEWIFQTYRKLAEQRRLCLDVVTYIDLKDSRDTAKAHAAYVGKYCGRLKIGGYKIFLDGSPQGRTAWLSKPYENGEPNYCGYPIYEDERVVTFGRQAMEDRMQLLAHCNGDAASEQFIYAMEQAGYRADMDLRPVMVHAQTVRYDQLDRMRALEMIPSFFVAHTYYWGDVHLKNLGQQRAEQISPVHTAIEKGMRYTFHQDAPVILPDMLKTVWAAVNRQTRSGVLLGAQERITPLQALQGITLHAAYQYFEEDRKGSLREGKLADLVILDQNPLKVSAQEIDRIAVLQTIKEGRTLYQKEK